jgi:hypothetical protein
MDNQAYKQSGSGYAKRPLWQWVLLYLVIGGVAYGLVYYFVLAKNGGYNYSSPAQDTTQDSEPFLEY